jgi:hypothetical protein
MMGLAVRRWNDGRKGRISSVESMKTGHPCLSSIEFLEGLEKLCQNLGSPRRDLLFFQGF